MIPFELSKDLNHTWFIDLDGTIIDHNSHLRDGDQLLPGVKEFWSNIPPDDYIVIVTGRDEVYKESTLKFLSDNGLRYNHAIFNLPLGERIVVNDIKPAGLRTAIAWNLVRNQGFVDPTKILLVSHSDNYHDDLSQCKNFNEVLTYFVKKNLEKHGAHCRVVNGGTWLGLKRQIKSFERNYHEMFDKSLLDEYPNVIFVGAVPLKITHDNIIKDLQKNITGMFAEFNEYSIEPHGDIVFYALPDDKRFENRIWVGPMYDSENLYPDKKYDTLVIHIDHHFPGRYDCFERIRSLINELKHNDYFKKNWKNFEVYYHSQQVEDIDQVDFYDIPPNIPFSDLSAIYRKTHVAFLSHRETLGMYPIEMTASGAYLVVLNRDFLPASIFDLVQPAEDDKDFWDKILPDITEVQSRKISTKVAACSYENGMKKVIEHIHQHHTTDSETKRSIIDSNADVT